MAHTELEVFQDPNKIIELTEKWDEKSRIRANEILSKNKDIQRRAWYCASPGRNCDGKAHDGYPYPHARASQWPPRGASWDTWLIMSGRGWGKTRVGGEFVRFVSQKVKRIAIIGQDIRSVRQTMVEGESGLEAICNAAGVGYEWSPANKEFRFENGSIAYGFSAEEPDALRGPQFGAAWLDEPAHMPRIQDVWDNLMYGLRLPGLPGGAKAVCTSTPLPGKWLKTLMTDESTTVTRGSSYENIENLDQSYKRRVIDKKAGTRSGRQELDGEYLEDVPGAMWQAGLIIRMQIPHTAADFDRIIVAIDPAGSNNRRSDETGIVVVGRIRDTCYVLEDASGKFSPKGWADTADRMYEKWFADAIVAEKNYGGDMVKETIESTGTRARVLVRTATRSKQLRADPVVALYEQARVFHNDSFQKLEDEMLSWVPGHGDSPNRIDALVWAINELIGGENTVAEFASPADLPAATGTTHLPSPGTTRDLDAAFAHLPPRRMTR